MYLEYTRWLKGPVCPHCGSISDKHYQLKIGGVFKGLYKCKDCRQRFTVTVGTMFEGSHIPLKKWLLAIYIFLSHKKGMSSVQLSKDIKVTQKTAWFMLSRIRCNLCKEKYCIDFYDNTQVDETFIGGKNRNKNYNKREKNTQGRSHKTKIPVIGLLSDGLVFAMPIPNTSGRVLKSVIKSMVRKGSTVITDGWCGYTGLSKDYNHIVVDHSKGLYTKDSFHTNSIEGFWSQLKRGIIGVYHLVSPKHLSKYCDEFIFRYNTREMADGCRLDHFLFIANERLSYSNLTAHDI